MVDRMYAENKKSVNSFVGCLHDCVYCKPSFQRMCKRSKCPLHKTYTPHFHPERLLKTPPKTQGNEFIFFPSCGDLAFANRNVVMAHIDYAEKYPDRTFLIQSKNPVWFSDYEFPDNVILGTTIETNERFFFTPSKYKQYSEISRAPEPFQRYRNMMMFHHKIKDVTIEPILDFSLDNPLSFTKWIEKIAETCKSLVIYVGYDNHSVKLPEPRLEKTERLILNLMEIPNADVRVKSLRQSWYEVKK